MLAVPHDARPQERPEPFPKLENQPHLRDDPPAAAARWVVADGYGARSNNHEAHVVPLAGAALVGWADWLARVKDGKTARVLALPGEPGLMSASRMTLLVLASIGISLALHYFRTVEYPASERRLELHRKMIEHDTPSQVRHRILAPFAAEGIARVLAVAEPGPVRWRSEDSGSSRPLLAAYFVLNAVAFSTALVALYLLLQSWYPIPWALAGALLAGAAIPLTFGDHYYHPDSPLELAFFAVGLLLMVRRRFGWLGLVVVLAALNRETSLFLVLAILWAMWNDRAGRAAALGYLVTWAAIFLGLRVGLGFPPPTFTMAMAWEGNRARWLESAVLNAVFLGAFWFCVARGLRQAPDAIARAAIVLPPYVALLLVIGYWWEIRYWLSMLPIVIPLGLASLTPVVGGASGQSANGGER